MLRIVLGILLFLSLDGAIFRSGLYGRVMTIDSMQGFAHHVATGLEARPPDPLHDVLVLGDSRISEGFNASLATRQQNGSGLVFLQGAIPGTTPRVTCFLLEHIDPHAARYRAIVLTVRSFRQTPMPDPITDDRLLDGDLLGPLISAPEFAEFASHQPKLSDRIVLWSRLLVSAQNYRADFTDLLLNTAQHLRAVAYGRRVGLDYGSDYQGHAATMERLALQPGGGDLVYPPGLTETQRATLRNDAFRHYPQSVPLEDAYQRYWIGRILRRYAGGTTRVFLLRMPYSPLPAAFDDAGKPLAHFVQDAAGLPSVTVLPETALMDMEQPALFFDGRHLNAAGRRLLTERLGRLVTGGL